MPYMSYLAEPLMFGNREEVPLSSNLRTITEAYENMKKNENR